MGPRGDEHLNFFLNFFRSFGNEGKKGLVYRNNTNQPDWKPGGREKGWIEHKHSSLCLSR